MIIGSLLLILGAIVLLVLGLSSGSSVLLIGSIVVSLLSAMALVIGARRTAGGRRVGAAPTPLAVDLDHDPGRATPVEETVGWASAAPGTGRTVPVDLSVSETVVGRRGPVEHQAAPDGVREPAAAAADTEVLARPDGAALDDGQVAGPYGADVRETTDPYVEFHRDQASPDAAEPPEQSRRHAWLHAPDQEFQAQQNAGSRSSGAAKLGDEKPTAAPVDAGRAAADAARADDEDPADEPPPQRVSPADGVRISQLVAEVLVVDGRPRYHLGDCASLDGRITEPLPVNEAVELGFTSCGMCCPVDRLVAEAARR